MGTPFGIVPHLLHASLVALLPCRLQLLLLLLQALVQLKDSFLHSTQTVSTVIQLRLQGSLCVSMHGDASAGAACSHVCMRAHVEQHL